ncbi:MAG: tRNA pseudouridine(38-40) synthase TruA [Candidatus Cloacimonadales bacterium]|nr:tRNA pseudouridine(38-40) synthase TruA [Candidatus Cloacimonadales bacterium]
MKRFFMKLAYDGTGFQGWQNQKKGRTVQQDIENILSEIAKTKIAVTGAGRTDAGVHALAQCVHFDFMIEMSANQILKAIQAKLPPDIQIVEVKKAVPDFSARYDAYQRTYEYIITKTPTPFNRHYKTYFKRKYLRPEIINACLPYFIGEHDFTSFSKFNPQIKSPICTVIDFSFRETTEDLYLEITANRFLHNMVRRIIGTVVNISHKNENPAVIKELIAACTTQNKLISTAPANGLYLKEIFYPENCFLCPPWKGELKGVRYNKK